ncbi:MAG: hypothetical protein R3B98_05420 [Hyphomonas sp.]
MTKVWKATALAAVLMGFGAAAIAQEETEVTTEMSADETAAMTEELEAAADTPEAAGDAAAGAPLGQWTRKNGDTVDITLNGNELFCTITEGKKAGFEMCHGMTLREDGTWKGKKMKHPGMPGFMTFNGTIKVDGDSLSIKGCAAGVCDSETWNKIAS